MGGAFIGTIPNGALLTGSEPWYDSSTGALQVVVFPPLNPNCQIRVQGMTPTQKPGGLWIVEVPLGGILPQWQTPPYIYQGLRYFEIPNIGALSDRHRTMKTLIQELVHLPTETVLSRTQISIYDGRNDGGFNPDYQGSLNYSLGFELSNTGVEALEPVHQSSLPTSSLSSFNTLLTDFIGGTKWSVLPPTGFAANNKACIPLNSADPDFLQTSAYSSAIAEASAQYLVWEAAHQACQSPNPLISIPGCAAASQNCVRDRTINRKNFELCVGKMEGTAKTLNVAGVDRVELALSNAVPLTSRIVLGRLDSTIDGTLGEVFIRWSDKHFGCTIRPKSNLSLIDEARPAIVTWKSCSALEADATGAQTQGVINHALPAALETLSATATDPAAPLFLLNANKPKNPDKGSCSEPKLRDHVLTILDLYYPTIESAVNTNWLSQHGVAMDNLMSRWESGVWENATDLDLTHTLRGVSYAAGDRMTMYADSEAFWPGAAFTEMVYSPPGAFPCFNAIAPGAPSLPCVMGLSFFNQPFDASVTVTTNAFNQMLRERLHVMQIVPTFEQLNATPPAGKLPTDIWELDGAQLSALFPAFSTLGTTKLRIVMTPNFAPYTYIPVDPIYWFRNNGQIELLSPPPSGRSPLTYQMSQYRITFVGDQPGPDGDYNWFEFRLDLFDPNFQVKTAANGRRNLIVPAFSDKFVYSLTMLKSQLANCPSRPVPIKAAGCGELLTAAVNQLVGKFLKGTSLAALEGFPAPQFYDASGTASATVQFNQQDKFQQRQVITFYGNLR